MARLIRLFALAALLAMWGCARAPLKDPRLALRPTSAPELHDDLPLEPLFKAIETECEFLEKTPGHDPLMFGEKSYSKAEYVAGLRHFVELGRKSATPDEFFKAVTKEFDFFEVYGDKHAGEAFITSYYEPIVPGSKKPTDKLWQPLYKQPDDLIMLDLVPFDAQKYALDRKLRGRVVVEQGIKKFVPYFTREEIDSKGALKGRRLELVYVDPVDSFMIQVQGSATVDLGKGKSLRVAYADKNGQVYEPVGKFVKQFIPPEKLSLQAIEDYLHTLPRDKLQEYLNKNPSYVFFREAKGETYLGVPPVDGRTAATDQRFFPKGALMFISTTKPKWDSADQFVPKDWQKLERFLLDQDIGGAITGGGRLDLYWGSGPEAKRNAGVMKQTAKLWYLAPRRQESPKP